LSSKVRLMSSGSDAPPDTATRNADWSRPAMSCWAGVQHGRHTADNRAPVGLDRVQHRGGLEARSSRSSMVSSIPT